MLKLSQRPASCYYAVISELLAHSRACCGESLIWHGASVTFAFACVIDVSCISDRDCHCLVRRLLQARWQVANHQMHTIQSKAETRTGTMLEVLLAMGRFAGKPCWQQEACRACCSTCITCCYPSSPPPCHPKPRLHPALQTAVARWGPAVVALRLEASWLWPRSLRTWTHCWLCWKL